MDELIDILTPEGKPTGKTALKSEAHKNGWFHATAHIWFFTSNKKILLQKRALTKKVFPGIWDISVAGHIGAGEAINATMGNSINWFKSRKNAPNADTRIHQVEHKNGIKDNEHQHVFIAELKVALATLNMQREEVDGLELWDLRVLKETKNLQKVLLPQFHKYYSSVYDKIIYNKIISYLKEN